jgi:hypothetical protein
VVVGGVEVERCDGKEQVVVETGNMTLLRQQRNFSMKIYWKL